MKPFKEVTTTQGPFVHVVWEDLEAGEEGQAYSILPVNGIGIFRTVHAAGEFDTASVEIQGGSIPDDFKGLNDMRQDTMIFYEPTIKSSPDIVFAVKPKVIGGTDKTKISIGMIVRKG